MLNFAEFKKYTMREGFLSYYEICERVSSNGWVEVWSNAENLPYAYNQTEWIAFENVDSMKIKVKKKFCIFITKHPILTVYFATLKASYIIEKKLAGAMIYASDTDDFKGTFCYQGKNPLTSALKNEFDEYLNAEKKKDSVQKLNVKKSKKERLYVCYYTNWSQYRPEGGTFFPENINATLCTHIIFAFAKIVGDDIVPYEWNDADLDYGPGN
jgi:chitinase